MGKIISLIGNRYGALIVLERAPKPEGSKSTSAFWLCQCDCGNTKIISGAVLKQGKAKSCGCTTSKLLTESHSEDLTGKKYGYLTVLSRAERPEGLKSTGAYWLCRCDCGKEKVIMGKSLRNGKTISCGCHLWQVTNIVGNKYGLLTVIEQDHSRRDEGNGTYWLCECECGGHISVQKTNLIHGHVKSCGCLSSSGELEIKKLLDEEQIPYTEQFSFSDLRGPKGGKLRFDFAIFDSKRAQLLSLVEFQGEQHYQNQQSKFFDYNILANDDLKKEYCSKHNIKLYCIPYWTRGTLSIDKIFSDKYLVRVEENKNDFRDI